MTDARPFHALTRMRSATPAQALVVLHVALAIVNSLTLWPVPRRLLVLVGVLILAYEAIEHRPWSVFR